MAMAAPAGSAIAIRERVQQQAARLRRVKLVDRLAVGFITLGGIFIIVSVLFIFVFIFGEALPLFRPPRRRAARSTWPRCRPTPAPAARRPAAPPAADVAIAPHLGKPLVIGIDEYQLYIYQVLSDGRLAFFKVSDGSFAKQVPPSWKGAR